MYVWMDGRTYVRTYACMYIAISKISQHICGVDWGWTATETIVTKIARHEKCRSVYHPFTIRLPSIWNCKAPMASTSVTGDPLVKTAMGHLEAVETSQLGSSCMPRRVRREFVESWLGEMDCGLWRWTTWLENHGKSRKYRCDRVKKPVERKERLRGPTGKNRQSLPTGWKKGALYSVHRPALDKQWLRKIMRRAKIEKKKPRGEGWLNRLAIWVWVVLICTE